MWLFLERDSVSVVWMGGSKFTGYFSGYGLLRAKWENWDVNDGNESKAWKGKYFKGLCGHLIFRYIFLPTFPLCQSQTTNNKQYETK